MSSASNYELPTTDESDFSNEDSSDELETSTVDYDFEKDPTQLKVSKRDAKRSYEAKKKIELLKEERRLKKLFENDYDDWD